MIEPEICFAELVDDMALAVSHDSTVDDSVDYSGNREGLQWR